MTVNYNITLGNTYKTKHAIIWAFFDLIYGHFDQQDIRFGLFLNQVDSPARKLGQKSVRNKVSPDYDPHHLTYT